MTVIDVFEDGASRDDHEQPDVIKRREGVRERRHG